MIRRIFIFSRIGVMPWLGRTWIVPPRRSVFSARLTPCLVVRVGIMVFCRMVICTTYVAMALHSAVGTVVCTRFAASPADNLRADTALASRTRRGDKGLGMANRRRLTLFREDRK